MKTVDVSETTLDLCVKEARKERLIITRKGRPVAVIIGLDAEQRELGGSDEFWTLIGERRTQKTFSRKDLDRQPNSGK